MSYGSVKELPESVRNNLPARVQDIYQEAFNIAWKEYPQQE
ncbi:ChaB family protein [Undibacterium arcticum]|uniref:ChaB family protein n=1 Tax=Undibacterium arcticum TaxID=1762892 RepID=A0ABV7F6F6_9BURK